MKGSKDKTARVWNVTRNQTEFILARHTDGVQKQNKKQIRKKSSGEKKRNETRYEEEK